MENISTSSSADLKREFNKLKHNLESWREVILILNGILKWEKKFYPAIIFGVISVKFLFLWYMNLSVLTLLSLTALSVTLLDYAFPLISTFIFKPENWNGTKEKLFENICSDIYNVKQKICGCLHNLLVAKEQKSTLYIVIVSAILLFLAWIGSVINNLFLSYLITLVVFLYPGLNEIGIIVKIKTFIGDFISTHLKSLKGKTTEAKTE